MKLDLDRLEKVRERGSKIIARCPACAEMKRDTAGDNLAIFDDGGFACIAYQQDRAHAHRIVQLAGKDEPRRGQSASFPPPRQRRVAAPPKLPQDFAAITRAARLRVFESAAVQEHIAAEFGVRPATIRRLSLSEGGALGFFPRISIGSTPCLPDRIGYIYPQGIKIRHPWGPASKVRFSWACGSATEPWRYTRASSRPWIKNYILTEGESDLIALVDALADSIIPEGGVAVVASPGTAFKPDWAALFRGCNITLAFDNDAAGAAANA
ncbi:MAG: hypothetical protein JWR15_3473, partial [Prosthecobacter sp.]|nr:hypothetical protein [Prosthecobacter sp.]